MEKFALAELYGKLANVFADIESHELKKTSNLKNIITGDTIMAQRKFGHPFKFTPFIKLIFSANKFPVVYDQSDGFFRRFVIVTWQRQFHGLDADTHLEEKLLSNKDEMNLVFNLLIRIAHNLNIRGHFIHSKRIAEIRTEWNRNSDPLLLFIETMVDERENAYETKLSAYTKYRDWCIARETEPMTINRFGRTFSEYYDTDQMKVDGINRKVWLDITIKDVNKQTILDDMADETLDEKDVKD